MVNFFSLQVKKITVKKPMMINRVLLVNFIHMVSTDNVNNV